METRTTRITSALGALTAGIVAGMIVSTSLVSAPAAQAAESDAKITQSSNTGVVIARDQSVPLTAVPTAPRAVTVTTSPNTRVTVKAPRSKTRSAKTNAKGLATFTKLKAGKKYTVTADGESATVVPVLKVGRARDLTIMTTSEPGTITATWAHVASKARGGLTVGYTLTATPVRVAVGVTTGVAVGDPDVPSISVETDSTEAVLRGLDPRVLYSFTVTPHNLLGEGRASVARMDRSLAEVSGIAVPSADDADRDSAGKTPSAEPSAVPVAAAPPAPTPAPTRAPQTRTIWVCPDEFTEVDGVCTQNRAYTFHTETETTAYTYHDEFVETNRIWHDHAFNPHNGCAYTVHGDRCMGWEIQGYTTNVKDAAPSGWTDNGAAYARDVDIKDATPEGWSDNGTEWIRTAAKVARTVPA
ncbi:MAG: hypothetical protein GKR85_08445 [Candidatus Nanopelagicales bacterium]|nr:hypothetical protein [Candidatus Nanopelagicales bacterium]